MVVRGKVNAIILGKHHAGIDQHTLGTFVELEYPCAAQPVPVSARQTLGAEACASAIAEKHAVIIAVVCIHVIVAAEDAFDIALLFMLLQDGIHAKFQSAHTLVGLVLRNRAVSPVI